MDHMSETHCSTSKGIFKDGIIPGGLRKQEEDDSNKSAEAGKQMHDWHPTELRRRIGAKTLWNSWAATGLMLPWSPREVWAEAVLDTQRNEGESG